MIPRDKHRRLGEMLVEKGLLTSGQLSLVLAEQQSTKEFLGTILVKHSIIKEEDLARALSEQFKMPFVSLKTHYIQWELVKQFSSGLILEHKCFPLSSSELRVTFAIINPLDAWALKMAEEESRGLKPEFVLATESDMQEMIKRYKQYTRSNIGKLFRLF